MLTITLGLLLTVCPPAATSLAQSKSDETSFLKEIRNQRYKGQWDAALFTLDTEIEAANQTNNGQREAKLLVVRGRVLYERSLFFQSDATLAWESLRRAERLAESLGETKTLADALYELSRLEYREVLREENGNWGPVRQRLQQIRKTQESLRDEAGLAETYFSLGLIDQMEDRNDAAQENFQASLVLAKKTDDKETQAQIYRHIGYVQDIQGETEAAREAYSKSLELLKEIGFDVAVPFAMLTLAQFQVEQDGVSAENIELLEEAVGLAQESNSRRAEYSARLFLGRLLLQQSQWIRAADHGRKAASQASAYGDENSALAAQGLVRAADNHRKLPK
jgi:tetratricopeptide (TPR) repeat protein